MHQFEIECRVSEFGQKLVIYLDHIEVRHGDGMKHIFPSEAQRNSYQGTKPHLT